MDTKNPPFGGNQDRGPTLNAVSWTLALLSLAFCTARIYSRAKLTRNMWWDDWFILLTMALTFAFTITWTVYAHNGGCRHVFYLSKTSQELALKTNWISQPFCVLGIALGKVSVIFLILRIGPRDKLRRWLLYVAAGSISILFGVQCIIIFTQCQPPRALWTFTIVGKCWPSEVLTVIAMTESTYSAFLDIALPAIAVSMIWSLQLPTRKKVNLTLIMSAGVLACVSAAIKVSKLPGESARSDFTWNTVDLFIWNAVEINAIIIAACVPTLRPVYLVLLGKPGAEHYKPRTKSSFHLPSFERERSIELQGNPSDPQRAFARDGAAVSRNQVSGLTEGVRKTLDIDVNYEDRKYLNPHETRVVQANSIV